MNERPSRVVRISVYMPAQSTLVDWAGNTQCIARSAEGRYGGVCNTWNTDLVLVRTTGNTVRIPAGIALVLTRTRLVFQTYSYGTNFRTLSYIVDSVLNLIPHENLCRNLRRTFSTTFSTSVTCSSTNFWTVLNVSISQCTKYFA